MNFQDYLKTTKEVVDKSLDKFLPEDGYPPKLIEAMRYSLFAGGKRIRPIITLAASQMCGGAIHQVMPVACAIEMIHTYSLIHDDLPAMDDDDMRRGRPTNHIVYGEAMAILAGDTLMTYAYQMLARESRVAGVSAEKIVRLVEELGLLTGVKGMAGGQVLDLEAEDKQVSLEELQKIHDLKTGALIKACIRCGAIVAGADDETIERLSVYSDHLGLLFQIVDDILDVTASSETLGKPAGSDEKNNKSTYVSLLGLEGAKEKAQKEADMAKKEIEFLKEKADFFMALVDYFQVREA